MPPSAPGTVLDRLRDGLNPEQLAAAEATTGPVRILAGAGTGKTRTITHRIGLQVLTGVARPDEILALSFTERAAGELSGRLADLGLDAPVRSATFHSAAWAQLRHFWPRIGGSQLPEVLPSKLPLLADAARRLGVDARDLAAEVEWAKARALPPEAYADSGRRLGRHDATRLAEAYRDYEQRKSQGGLVDYEDMLLRLRDLLVSDDTARAEVQERYRVFTVDEFQDTNPAQWQLLETWLGDRDDLCVVGDDQQAIFGFTGASARYLRAFPQHFPQARSFALTLNYRSTPQVLALAGRLSGPRQHRLRATAATGPPPRLLECADQDAEVLAVHDAIGRLHADGVPYGEMAVCYRLNRQSEPFEQALGRSGIPFVVRGEGGFYQRREVRQALRVLVDAAGRGSDERVDRAVAKVFRERLGWHPRREPSGTAAAERWRNLGLLHELAVAEARTRPGITLPELVAALDERAAFGRGSRVEADAVNLLSLHRAKGLEFDAVFIVGVEEGLLPFSQARADAEVAEERRLLHVGLTRARRHLWVTWARQRPGRDGKPARRRPSRFLDS